MTVNGSKRRRGEIERIHESKIKEAERGDSGPGEKRACVMSKTQSRITRYMMEGAGEIGNPF